MTAMEHQYRARVEVAYFKFSFFHLAGWQGRPIRVTSQPQTVDNMLHPESDTLTPIHSCSG